LSKVLSPETTFDERIAQRTAAIGIVGLGYAGLPLAMAFAETGFDVTGIDLNGERVRAVQTRESYLVDVPSGRYENLDGTLSATTDYAAVTDATGHYTISGILPGTYPAVFARGSGYDRQVTTLSVASRPSTKNWTKPARARSCAGRACTRR